MKGKIGMSNIGTADLDRAKTQRAEMDDTFWFTPESGQGKTWGENHVRVLPPHVTADGLFYFGVPIHFKVGPGQQNYPCPRRAKIGDCPICIAGFKIREEGNEDAFKKLMPSMQAYMNVIPLNVDGTPKGDQARIRTWSVSRKILDQLILEFETNGDFTGVKDGKDIRVMRRGQMFDTEYRIDFAKVSSLSDDTIAIVEEEIRDLRQVSPFVDSAVLEKALLGGGGDPFKTPAVGAGPKTPEVQQPAEDRFAVTAGNAETSPEPPSDDQREAARKRIADAGKSDSGG